MKYNPAQFIAQVRKEIARVTWPEKKEVFVTAAIVAVMVLIMAVFFIIIDAIIAAALNFILTI